MPTYADLYNERLLALGQSGPSNPVRLTISKGDYVWDPQLSRFRYEEQWEEEHLMEHEELHDDALLAAPASPRYSDSRGSTAPPLAALQSLTSHGHTEGSMYPPSLWVLDTNTLMSCLELLKALFAALLTRNVAYAAALRQPTPSLAVTTGPSLIRLVIPYVVVSELDGLKVTRRKDDSGRPVASQAREANHWLLSALQKQKRVPIDEAGSHLSEELWPLFVQPSTHYHRSKRNHGGGSRWEDSLSCDDEIVKFCADLRDQTPSHVRFCSDDINARTKAELDNIDSLGMRELANALSLGFEAVQSSERKWTLVAEALIDQWEYQIGTSHSAGNHASQPQQGVNEHADQHAWRSGAFAPTHPSSMLNDAYTQTLHSSETLTLPSSHSSTISSAHEILEVDMETVEQQPHLNSPAPVPLMSVYPAGSTMRSSASLEGRGTNDSIHSPHNAQQAAKGKPKRQPIGPSRDSFTASPLRIAADGQRQDESEALNPQISWEELIQQAGSGSKVAAPRHRNGRW